MFKLIRNLLYACAVFLVVLPLVSCSGGSGTGSGSGSGTLGTTGSLDIGLTDAPGDYLHVFVTIVKVQVKQGLDDGKSGWVTVSTPNQTFDLLALQNGVIAPLGSAELEAGQYNQMRLILTDVKPPSHPYANYLVIEGVAEPVELKVPSGLQTGIKIVQGFDIEVAGSTELILDFDADKSVVQAGKSGKWLLKPTIKVLETVTLSVSGVVTDDTSAPLNGAAVSAQVNNSGAADPAHEITTVAGAESDSVDVLGDGNIVDGYYFMYLPITHDTFNIVATMDGYLPDCQVLDATTRVMAYENYNFSLVPAAGTGTLSGSATGLTTADSALFSIRQEVGSCGMVEVASASVVNSTAEPATYFEAVSLPVGTYEVVVSADGEVTQVWTIEVAADTETVLDTYFPTTTVEGLVSDGTNPLAGAVISVQDYNSGAADPKDAVTEINETETDIVGAYFTYLPTYLGSYNVAALMDGYVPQCQTAAVGTANILDFALAAPAETGTISGSVINLATAGPVLFSIRQDLGACGMVELATATLANGESFGPITFPVGTYEVVASSVGETTRVVPVDLLVGEAESVDLDFTP